MIGVLVNTATVIVGSLIGLLFKKNISKRITDAVMLGIGLCTIYIGISGTLKGGNALVVILSTTFGAVIGTALDIDKGINSLGSWVASRLSKGDGGSASVAEGFVTACLLFCIGSMTFVGCLNAGLTGDNQILFTKSLLDLISSVILSVSLGGGVICAAVFVLTFEGSLVLLAHLLQPLLTTSSIAQITCVGSLFILALGLNLIGVTKIKVANYLPAILLAPLFGWLVTLVKLG